MKEIMNLYHTVLPVKIPDIREHGLLKEKSNFWKGIGGVIYLSEHPFRPKGKVVLLINTDGLEMTRLSDWEYCVWEDIPFKRIQILGTGCVKCGLCGDKHLAGFKSHIAIPCECAKCHEMSCYFEPEESQ